MMIILPGAQPWLKSWGGPRFGFQHRSACPPRPSQRPRWVLDAGGGRPLSLWGSGGIPRKFLKTQMLNHAFWWLLAVKLLVFWKLWPISWGTNTLLVPQPISRGTSISRSLRLLRLWILHLCFRRAAIHDTAWLSRWWCATYEQQSGAASGQQRNLATSPKDYFNFWNSNLYPEIYELTFSSKTLKFILYKFSPLPICDLRH